MDLHKRNTRLLRIRRKRNAFQRRRKLHMQKTLLQSNECIQNRMHKKACFNREPSSIITEPFIHDYEIIPNSMDVLLEDYEVIEHIHTEKEQRT